MQRLRSRPYAFLPVVQANTISRWSQSFLPVLRQILPLFLLFLLLERVGRELGYLESGSYEADWLLWEVIKESIQQPHWLLLFLIPFGLTYRKLTSPWSELDYGRQWRLLAAIMVSVVAWPMATYDMNYFYGQAHNLDRLVVALLPVAVFYRPVFVMPAVVLLNMMLKQFDYPLGNFLWAETNLIVKALSLSAAAIFLRQFTGRKQFNNMLFLLICLIAAQYVNGGLFKLRINWITFPHINHLIVGGHSVGWSRFLPANTAGQFSEWVSWANLPLMGLTLVLEAGALFVLWRRNVTKLFLIGWPLLHSGIFVYSGFLFWKWIVVELTIFVFLFTSRKLADFDFYKTPYFILSIILLLSCRLWANPPNLTWFDTPLAYGYQFEVIGESGRNYQLHPYALSFYSDSFILGVFDRLTTEPQLTNAFAVTSDRWMADELLTMEDLADIRALEADFEPYLTDPEFVAAFDHFLITYLSNWNEAVASQPLLSVVPYPRHLWSSPYMEPYEGQERAVGLKLYQNVTFYHEGEIVPVRRTLFHELAIP